VSATEILLQALPYVAVGFLAQLVDGALGMAFGAICSTLLVSMLGMPPARASAMVHLVETFTTAASAVSHSIARNVDWRLFARLAVPGAIGGAAGAYALSNIDASVARPVVLVYLALIGVYLLWRGWKGFVAAARPPKVVAPLGLVGGFLDAAGGGGWGPVVSSNLLVQGGAPRQVVGTVNTAEFVVTLTISATFLLTLGPAAFTVAAGGLIAGGLLAAPLGAILVKRLSARTLLLMVGVVLIATSLFGLWKALS
jgi:hypothetical protein